MTPTPLMNHIVPGITTNWERNLADQVNRLLNLNISIRDVWDPMKCPIEFLPYLAWSVSVDIWKSEWPEFKKRQITADAIGLHKIKGTEDALRRYVSQVDARVVEVVTPPQDFFAAPDPTKEELDDYVRQLPELRLYLGHDLGSADGLFADEGFFDNTFATFDKSDAIYGRRATLYQHGSETDLKVVKIDTVTIESHSVDVERISVNGLSGDGCFCDFSFTDDAFADASLKEATVYTVTVDGSYNHEQSSIRLSNVSPGLDPISPRHERGSIMGDSDLGFYADLSYSDKNSVQRDRSPDLVFDKVYLFDPTITGPLGGYGAFADHTRIGMKPFTAEVMIDASREAATYEAYSDIFFAGQSFAAEEDNRYLEDIFNAINVSKSLSDTVLATFETTRPANLDDGLDLNQGVDFSARVLRQL